MTGRTLSVLLLVACSALASPGEARAWGSEGHKIVCEIAWRRLAPEARDLVRRLRSVDPEPGASFAESCAWADEARFKTHRGTTEYHYVNIARGAEGMDLGRDCPAYDCIVIGIRRYAVYLARDDTSDEEKAEALKFLAHFVGDVHQPLHAGYREDRGGNDIFVDWFGDRDLADDDVNLHAVWDRRILLRGKLSHPQAALALDAEIAEEEAAEWRHLDVEAWIDESYRLAVDVAYDLPEDEALGTEYFERSLDVAREQMRKAGVRLAFFINSIVGGSFEPGP